MTNPAPPTPGASERVSISCPGCGRHNWVSWPVGQATLAYICFNCQKSSELHRKGSGH